MQYRDKNIEEFMALPVPSWKRVSLPDDLFDIGYTSTIPKIRSNNCEVYKLSEIMSDEFNQPKIKDKVMEFVDIDTKSKKNLGRKFLSFMNSSEDSHVIIANDNSKEAVTSISYSPSSDINTHYLIIANQDVNLTVNIDYKNQNDEKIKSFNLIKVVALRDSNVTINRVQRLSERSYSFDQSILYAEDNSHIKYNDIQIGSSKKAIAVDGLLIGDRSEITLGSAYFGDLNSESDISYSMTHMGKKSKSEILSKGALQTGSKKVFRGNLQFEKGSSGSAGSEKEYVLLLDENIKSDSIPALMCSEDDVVGEHAASVGQIDDNKLFYIMSRGMDEVSAKKLIVKASFAEIVESLDEEGRDDIMSEIEGRIS